MQTTDTPTALSTNPKLTSSLIERLLKHEISVIRIPNFTHPETCKHIGEGLKNAGYNDYLNAPTVGRIGMSFFETSDKQSLIEFYFKTALENIEKLRSACAPYQSPIDVFRCVIDEVWPNGANLQTLSGRKMFVGLSRNMRPGAPLLAHHDMFSRLAPLDVEANDLSMQMAVNIYVDMPQEGGELLMWRDEISDAEFLIRRGEKYGMDLELLAAPDIIVKPKIGDLIIFNARKLHAVAPGRGSDRLTVSCFLGYRSHFQPLTVWS